MNIMEKSNAAVKIYQLNYIVGFGISFILFFAANKIWPPPGLGIAEGFDESDAAIDGTVLDAESGEGSGTETPTKVAMTVGEKDVTF